MLWWFCAVSAAAARWCACLTFIVLALHVVATYNIDVQRAWFYRLGIPRLASIYFYSEVVSNKTSSPFFRKSRKYSRLNIMTVFFCVATTYNSSIDRWYSLHSCSIDSVHFTGAVSEAILSSSFQILHWELWYRQYQSAFYISQNWKRTIAGHLTVSPLSIVSFK